MRQPKATRKVGRSSITGRFLSIAQAKATPETTVIETIRIRSARRRRAALRRRAARH